MSVAVDRIVYGSDLAVSALGIQPEGVPWSREPTRCACCGKPVLPGDLAVRDKDRFGPQFTDGPYLACKGSGAVCGACSAVMNAKPLRALQRAVVTANAVYPIGRDAHRTWLLLQPPEPPYVAVVSDTKQAHLVWRTPVTMDNNLVVVRLGSRLLRIRRWLLEQAISDCQLVADAVNAARDAGDGQGRRKKAAVAGLRHPFVALSRELSEQAHGILRREVACEDERSPGSDVGKAVARLKRLGPGELWGLATLAKREVEAPERPEPISLNTVPQEDEAAT